MARARVGKGAVAPFGEEVFEEIEEVVGVGDAGPEEVEEGGAVTGGDAGDGGPQVGEDGAEGGGEAVH